MEPQVMAPVRYNTISAKLKEHIAEFEAKKGITPGEALVFVCIGSGDTREIAYKSTFDADAMLDAQRSKPAPTVNLLNGESIIDPGTGDYAQLMYFRGGWMPGKQKATVWFTGKDGQSSLVVRKSANLALYMHLILSNYLEDNANPSRQEPDGGYLYRLLRPSEEVEDDWAEEMAKAAVTGKIAVATRKTLLRIAPKLSIPHQENMSDAKLRSNFLAYSKRQQNYKLLDQMFEADDNQVFEAVDKAVELNVVAVDKEKAMWVFTHNGEVITNASPTHSTTDQLVTFLPVQDGQTAYKQLLVLTEQAESKKGKAPKGKGKTEGVEPEPQA